MGVPTSIGHQEELDARLADNLPGNLAFSNLRVEADVVDGTKVVVAGDTYEIEVITTDSGDNTANGDFVGTADPLDVDLSQSDYTNLIPLITGDVIRIGTEMMRVIGTRVDSATGVTLTRFSRGYAGTTNATHADAADILVHAAALTVTGAFSVPLITTLTPAAFIDSFVGVLNELNDQSLRAIDLTATNEVLIYRTIPGAFTAACSETLAGANNTIDAAFRAGFAKSALAISTQSRVPTASEVGTGTMLFPLPFDPTLVFVRVITTATGVAVAWVGAKAITVASGGDSAFVTVDNIGAVDFATTDTVEIIAVG